MFSFPAFSQNKIDSLESLVEQTGDDSLKLIWYSQLRRLASYSNPKKAEGYILKSIDIYQTSGNTRKLNIMKIYLGNIYYSLGKSSDALTLFIKAEEYFSQKKDKKDISILGNVYNGMAAAYESSGNDTITLKYFTKAYDTFKSIDDPRKMGIALNNISNIYYDRGQFRKTIQVLEEALVISKNNELPEYKASLLNNLAGALKEIGEFNQSDSILHDLLSYTNEEENALHVMAIYRTLGENQVLQNHFKKGVFFLEKAKKIAVENNFTLLKEDILYELYMAYNLNKQTKEALNTLHQYTLVHDSIFTKEKDKNLSDAMQKYEAEKREKELTQTQHELEKESLQKRSFIITSLASIILAGIAFWFLYFKSKTNRLLQSQKGIIEKALKEKEILLKEIHHRVKNNLQVISSLLNLQSRSVENEQAKAAIQEGRNRVKSMGLIHQNLYQSDNITGMDVGDYIGKLGESLFNSYNINSEKIKFNINAVPIQLDVDTLIPLGLILNELLSNALKHAFPEEKEGKIEVNFKKVEDALLLQVKDDGVGMSSTKPDKNKNSFGMKLIEAFSQKLNASVEIIEQKGTEVNILVKDFRLIIKSC